MTMLSYKVRVLSPMIPVAEMGRSIGFYREVLGFEVTMESAGYSMLTRDGVSLHLTRAVEGAEAAARRGEMSIYLEVQEIESLWSHVARFKDRYRIRDLFDREYGMREFHIVDPDDCLIFVGEKIERPQGSAGAA